MFKHAKWISNSLTAQKKGAIENVHDASILLRKEFDVLPEVTKAIVNVCAVGLGVYTLNGAKVTDEVLCTPFTKYDKRLIYQTYDITDKIVCGKNVFAAHIGNGFYNDNALTWNNSTGSWNDNPKLIARIDVTYVDGSCDTIFSDSSWLTDYGPCAYNHARQGEIYDMNLVQHGYDTPEFDASAWGRAVVVKAPGGILVPMDMPPIRIIRTLKPVSFENGVYDFGENISGWVRIKATGRPSQKMHMKYEEWILENGDFSGHIDIFNRQDNLKLSHEEYVIFSGRENEEYAPSFCYHGFRYVKVENAPGNLEIVAEVVHTDLETIGTFKCSDEMLNKIHKATVQATLSNYHGIPTDCPHREQNGWTGDSLISAHQALKNFDMHKAYRKWLFDFKDVQRPNGQIPCIIPTAGWGYNWGCGPAWDSALVLIPLYMYHACGDVGILEDMWENIELYMDFIYSMSEDYIVDFGLGDWCPPPDTDVCPTVITDTAYYYADALACKEIAELLGKASDKWDELAGNIRSAWRNKFLDCKEHFNKQTYFACALYQGMLGDDEIPVYAKKLAELVINNGYHIDCGILGTKYIFDALSANGYADVIYKMITVPTMPSYAYWINNGMTALTESWELRNSQNHHMFSEVDNWLYKYVGGIDLKDGKVIIEPRVIEGIDETEVTWRDVTVKRSGKSFNVTTGRNVIIKNKGVASEHKPGSYSYEI